ncbi:hypothetical protein ACL02R_20865 [Streptomyces sp. MS19]|uniref:hypothetical protein n=1 Tax=Streptomyces sp. MS19 TaxID=3385972 RepID=UPI0039A0A1BE
MTAGHPAPPRPHVAAAPHPPGALRHLDDQEYTYVTRTAPQLVRAALGGLESRFPAIRDYTGQQLRHTADDIAQIVDFLAASLYADDPELFTGFVRWTGGILAARGVPARSLAPTLDVLAGRLADFPRAARHLAEARRAVGGDAPSSGASTGQGTAA